jgi:hypothetical protein
LGAIYVCVIQFKMAAPHRPLQRQQPNLRRLPLTAAEMNSIDQDPRSTGALAKDGVLGLIAGPLV